MALSADGLVVAIGAQYNEPPEWLGYPHTGNWGHVRVYAWDADANAWAPRGGSIDGEADIDYFGYSVALSADGAVVVCGAIYNDDNGNDAGYARVLAWDGAAWQDVKRLLGEATRDNLGGVVAMSADGATIAVGAPGNDGNDGALADSGHVRVYAAQYHAARRRRLRGSVAA